MESGKFRPELTELLIGIGEAGQRVSAIGASEAAAGNISIYTGWDLAIQQCFPDAEEVELPVPAPALAGGIVLATGAGRRLREIADDPEANVGALRVHVDGQSATLCTSPRRRFHALTSELNSHLAVHEDQVAKRSTTFQAIVHAQPPHLTYLSHIPAYRDVAYLNRRLLRWEAETIVSLPEGVGVIDFLVPGSDGLMSANVTRLRAFQIVLWSKHGVMARSDLSVGKVVDTIEYAETAAHYEYMDVLVGGLGEGLTEDETASVAKAFGLASPWA